MSRIKPAYFDRVRKEARGIWEKLEADPKLAAPWRQLFSQVKSPRHVLSELIQNADDSGATWVRSGFDGRVFYFQHNGEDFDPETLSSLCQFGISNKAHLHTIGFRGLGFKSTFSLGPRVEVYTPTLAFAFNEKRFTEPIWIDDAPETDYTQIQISTRDDQILEKVEAELERWIKSPVPLLFFQYITKLELQGETITRKAQEAGPVPNSEWVLLKTRGDRDYVLKVQSGAEDFPDEALQEVRQERAADELELPPCTVEIVFGLSDQQRIYVVLPSEVRLSLPFSCNGPFLQDPARTGIRDPSISPTNRWLLKRVGQLAASTMLAWLNQRGLSIEKRAEAYGLMPQVSGERGSLSQDCARTITRSFGQETENEPILLTEDGSLARREECLGIRTQLLEVWSAQQLVQMFGKGQQCVLAPEVEHEARQKLSSWSYLDLVSDEAIVNRLIQGAPPPRPEDFKALLTLWEFIAPLVNSYTFVNYAQHLRIVPVKDRGTLDSATDVMVLGDREGQLTPSDWSFLVKNVDLVDPDWIEILTEPSRKRRKSELSKDARIGVAAGLLRQLRLDQRIGVQQVVEKVGELIFEFKDPGNDGIQLGQIAARANVYIREDFKFLCRDGNWRPLSSGLVVELASDLESFLPSEWVAKRLLHDEYQSTLRAGDRSKWSAWATKVGLQTFPIPTMKKTRVYGYNEVERFCRQHGGQAPFRPRTGSENFEFEDSDFDPPLWAHWKDLAKADKDLWVKIVKHISKCWSEAWEKRGVAQVRQIAGSKVYLVEHTKLVATWVLRLRELPCLPDTFNKPEIPSNLLRINAETAAMLHVEQFVHRDLDKPKNQALLDLLGARSKPDNATKLIERLRALAQSPQPPLQHLFDLYRSIDRVLARLDAKQIEDIRPIFKQERLIWTQDGKWQYSTVVFQDNSDQVPDVSIIHESVRDLPMWDRLEVSKYPTLERALAWLKGLEVGKQLENADRNTVKQILRRAPGQIWSELGAWLDLSGRWCSVSVLKWWAASLRPSDTGLFLSVKRSTADLSMIDPDQISNLPMSKLPPLESVLEYRVPDHLLAEGLATPPWLTTLARGLARIQLKESEPDRANGNDSMPAYRETALRLAQVHWHQPKMLEVRPYLNGEPAGESRSMKALWQGDHIFVVGKAPSHHRQLVETLLAHFEQAEIRQALTDCLARDPNWIEEYLQDRFTLLPGIPIFPMTLVEGKGEKEVVGTGEPLEEEDWDNPATVSVAPTDPPVTGVVPSSHPKPKKPQPERPAPPKEDRVLEFLSGLGFSWNSTHQFLTDRYGNAMHKGEGLFDWIKYDSSGHQVEFYWIGKQSLAEGVEIEWEAWEAIKQKSDAAWLVLPDASGKLVRHSYSKIQKLIEAEEITVHPAIYRLKMAAHA